MNRICFKTFAACFVLAVAGCTTETHPVTATKPRTQISLRDVSIPKTDGVNKPNPAAPTPPVRTLDADQAVATDPCGAKLHDIAGAMLLYFAVNKQLPDQLAQLQADGDPAVGLDFTCPVSGQPYGYDPAGLRATGRNKKIIVYDAQPSHQGKRWCIVAADSNAAAAQSLEVLEITEAVFRTYAPVSR